MAPTPPLQTRSSLAWNLLKIVLALGLVLFVFSQTSLAELRATLSSASVFWLLLSAVLFVALTLLKALQYYVLLRTEMTYAQVLHVIIWQNAVTNFFLAGAGILAYITTTRIEHEVKISRSVTIFLLTKAGDLMAIWIVLAISSRLVWHQIPALQIPVLVLLGSIGTAIAFFFLTVLFRQRFVSLLGRGLARLGLARMKPVEKGLSYMRGLADMKQAKVLWLLGLLLLISFIYLAITIVWIDANLAIFHLQPGFLAVTFVSVLIQLVSYFPVSVFGGLGINETSALYFWSFFQIPRDELASALIGIRIVFYLFNLIPLIYLPLYSAFHRPHEKT